MNVVDLSELGIRVKNILRNVAPSGLYEEAIRGEPGTAISDGGALIAYSGTKTGRSPSDKRVIESPETKSDVWWGSVNIPLDTHGFAINRERAIDYLNTRDHLYVVDGYAGWDPKYRIKVRVVCARPYHALFMHNMLIRPTATELDSFGAPDCTILNAGAFPANRYTTGMTSKTSVDLDLANREVVILGTEYAGEMKKAVFTLMNYLMPKQGVLSMHCSATTNDDDTNASVLFGLSGTGKTTLSADPHRLLVGDDEHGWSDDGIFNIEGGCYAKVWLVNTGWTGGAYGAGKRIPLKYTRAIIDAIHDGTLDDAPVATDEYFGLEMVTQCKDVPSEILQPGICWPDHEAYDQTARTLVNLFHQNFQSYASEIRDVVLKAGPHVA